MSATVRSSQPFALVRTLLACPGQVTAAPGPVPLVLLCKVYHSRLLVISLRGTTGAKDLAASIMPRRFLIALSDLPARAAATNTDSSRSRSPVAVQDRRLFRVSFLWQTVTSHYISVVIHRRSGTSPFLRGSCWVAAQSRPGAAGRAARPPDPLLTWADATRVKTVVPPGSTTEDGGQPRASLARPLPTPAAANRRRMRPFTLGRRP